MATTGARTRAAAAEVVDAVVEGGKSLDAAIAAHEMQLPPADRSLLRMLAFGVLRHHWRLQDWIDTLVKRPFRKRDRIVNALLAVGLYQLTDTRVPDHAAVSQTVEAARVLRQPKFAGVVNACLRRFQRERLADAEPRGDAARWNHPDWLIASLREDWPAEAEAILAANNAQAPMWLRANAARGGAAVSRERLASAGIAAERLDGVPDALRLAEPHAVGDLPGFAAGELSVQDAAAQIAGRWVMAHAPRRVLDACAAPGGKSGHLLELGGEDFDLTCVDSDAERLERVRENHERLGLDATIVHVMHRNRESGGIPSRSTRSCSMRHAQRRASSGGIPISSCCGGPTTSGG